MPRAAWQYTASLTEHRAAYQIERQTEAMLQLVLRARFDPQFTWVKVRLLARLQLELIWWPAKHDQMDMAKLLCESGA